MLDHDTFELKGRWEQDRGPQHLAYDFAWHLGHDTMITSEWGTPNMVRDGVNPELLLGGKYGNSLHVWDLRKGTHLQKLDLGDEYQMVLELRPAHNPRKAYGFVGVVISLKDLSASIWLWYLDGANGNGASGEWKVKKVIEIPAEPADPADLPPLLQGFKAVPPLVTDINLSLDDRFLYVSCWGTGELRQYDVTDPFTPGAHRQRADRRHRARAAAHPAQPGQAAQRRAADGGGEPRRPAGLPHQRALHAVGRAVLSRRDPRAGWRSSTPARGRDGARPAVLPGDGATAFRCHQVRLQGGDASSDSFCFVVIGRARRCSWPCAPGRLGAVHGINPAWVGSSPSRSGCRGGAGARSGARSAPLALGHALAIGSPLGWPPACGRLVPPRTLSDGSSRRCWSASACSGWCARGTSPTAACG